MGKVQWAECARGHSTTDDALAEALERVAPVATMEKGPLLADTEEECSIYGVEQARDGDSGSEASSEQDGRAWLSLDLAIDRDAEHAPHHANGLAMVVSVE